MAGRFQEKERWGRRNVSKGGIGKVVHENVIVERESRFVKIARLRRRDVDLSPGLVTFADNSEPHMAGGYQKTPFKGSMEAKGNGFIGH
jgi:hypothetical protein